MFETLVYYKVECYLIHCIQIGEKARFLNVYKADKLVRCYLSLGIFNHGSTCAFFQLEDYYQLFNKLDIRYLLGPNWDVYLATFLAIVLGIVILVARHGR